MTHRLSTDQFHHPLEEIADVEQYLHQREYMWQRPKGVRPEAPWEHLWFEQAKNHAERRLESLDAGLPTVGPYL
jgi:hypothetical protein